MPDLTILLDCPVETGLARTRLRTNTAHRGPDRFEGQDLDLHRRVREGFMTLTRRDPERFGWSIPIGRRREFSPISPSSWTI